jgi:predicted secreted protein
MADGLGHLRPGFLSYMTASSPARNSVSANGPSRADSVAVPPLPRPKIPSRRVPIGLATLLAWLTLATPARAETVLHLAETATVMAAPDEIAATLRAEATGASASDAQARVNAAMQQALAQAHKIDGLVISTGGYGVWRTGPTSADRNERWQVSQTLSLTGHDGPSLLNLVGVLQQQGLAVGGLNWRLSRDAERQAHQAATKQALSGLRGRVEEAAALLDLRFDQFKEVRLDTPGQQPMPRGMSAGSAPPPSAAPEDVPVSATAEADAILLPR